MPGSRVRARWLPGAGAAVLLALALGVAGPAGAVSFSTASTTPDLSQLADISWNNYCAPTSGADLLYYFGGAYSGLLQGRVPGDNAGADFLITELAIAMGTSLTSGTTTANLVLGLDSYLELWDGSAAVS